MGLERRHYEFFNQAIHVGNVSTYTLTAAQNHSYVTNSGTAQNVEIFLPKAQPGMGFHIIQWTGDYEIKATKNTTDVIYWPFGSGVTSVFCSAGSNREGFSLKLFALDDSGWEIGKIAGNWGQVA